MVNHSILFLISLQDYKNLILAPCLNIYDNKNLIDLDILSYSL